METTQLPAAQSLIHTACGRTIAVSRFAPGSLPIEMGRVVLDTACEPYDRSEVWASLTPGEARNLAGLLLFQAAAVESPHLDAPGHVEVTPMGADAYAITVRGHVLSVDQPLPDGGTDTAPTPVELFVASMASCVAHYAGRYLDRHQVTRDGLRVGADYSMAIDRPARVGAVTVRLTVPGLPPERIQALRAVVSHCTVENTLDSPPDVTVTLNDSGGNPIR
ncbi:OsmC family protein [Kitasatospora sp. MAP5-34]|uniref:OsmC family protein n=1 Tax=Kitasatospora sp. MAP5-34 TaxID=3035102 RepID=UPI0024761CA9|nr:OsmC family protein [Kitasatospora sp. MAP5-34]MDH6574691.1 putative redox protein [Kitasatospora sp. MAP5-34]